LAASLKRSLQSGEAGSFEVHHASSSAEARTMVEQDGASLLAAVVDLNGSTEAAALIRELQSGGRVPAVYAADLSPAGSADAGPAMRAGARGVLLRADDLANELAKSQTLSQFAHKRAKLVLFAPAQDGAGASTAALHTACYLADELRARTLLAEIDYYSDSIAYRLRSKEFRSQSELAPDEDWRSAITKWKGLHVLAAPTSARTLRTRGLPKTARAIAEACGAYDFVVGDLPCNTAVVSPELLSAADLLYVVATAELTSLYLARRRVQNLVTAGAKKGCVRLLLNRDRPGAVDSDLAKQVTGLEPGHRLPNDFAATSEAETDAALVSQSSPLGRAYAALAAEVYGKPLKREAAHAGRWERLLAAFR
jgi:Flp pilus assembly CpaE family ATPase